MRIGFGLLDYDPHEHERREQAHEDLIAAFRKRDPDLAAQAIFDHLARNEDTARTALDAYRTDATKGPRSKDATLRAGIALRDLATRGPNHGEKTPGR